MVSVNHGEGGREQLPVGIEGEGEKGRWSMQRGGNGGRTLRMRQMTGCDNRSHVVSDKLDYPTDIR